MIAKQIALAIDANTDPKEIAEKITAAITQAMEEEKSEAREDLLILESVICRTALAMSGNGEELIKEATKRILDNQKNEIANADDESAFLDFTKDMKKAEERLVLQMSIDGIAEGDYEKASMVAEMKRNQLVESNSGLIN